MPAAALDLEAYLPRFGLSSFRPGQREVIEAVLAGHDCLCVMPTGGGKSLCYQLPALTGDGLTLVVSPLIALMKDQVDALDALGIRATFVNSTLDANEQAARLDGMARGDYELVYVVPERFRSPRFVDAVRQTKLKLLAIDEAHCISEWGHDFRPDYARLGQYRAKLGQPPTIALTATATDAVRRDIVALLNLQTPTTIVTGFARPNLFYEVQLPGGQRDKEESLVKFLKQTPGTGIVYASSRKRCEEVAEMIQERTGRRTLAYHAGMMNEDRTRAQDAFMSGKVEIVVATTAFGMGIDKADVRFVVHYNLPGSLEGYYQEAGRAGRDGLTAKCLFLYSPGDRYIHEFFIENAYPARETVKDVYEYLLELEQDPIELTQEEVKEALGLSIGPDGIRACEVLLEKAGVLERLEAYQNMAVVRLSSDLPTLVDLLPPQAKSKRRVLRAIEQIVGPRRHELVYFQLRDLSLELEMEPTAVSRALKELMELECFDFVPPFRGRAIHVLHRDKPFDALEIDFETLEKRKTAEYERLDRVVNFAKGRHCRQLEILNYFGDAEARPCGHCDNCSRSGVAGTKPKTAGEAATAKPSPTFVETVRKALAGVARCQDRFGEGKGLGKMAVAKMLCGSKATEMSKWRLDKLSTYGLLAHLRQDEVTELLDALIGARYVEQVEIDRFRPIVRLTDAGLELMKGQAEIAGRLPLRQDLYTKINGTSPPRAPVTPTARAPASPETNGATSETHSAVQSPPPAHSLPPARDSAPISQLNPTHPPASAPASAGENAPEQPVYYWTWRLLCDGYTPAACAAIRRLSLAEVIEHARQAKADGLADEA